jgi:hypothetical protein
MELVVNGLGIFGLADATAGRQSCSAVTAGDSCGVCLHNRHENEGLRNQEAIKIIYLLYSNCCLIFLAIIGDSSLCVLYSK